MKSAVVAKDGVGIGGQARRAEGIHPPPIPVDATGAPHSNEMTTVERIHKLEDGALENVITVTDPVYYSEPFSARFVYDYHPDVRLRDYVCGEPHRNISHIQGITEARQNLRPFN